MEEWRKVLGNPNYEVSNQGRVRKITKTNGTHLCKMRSAKRGYTVAMGGTTVQVGRLVAAAFIPNPYKFEVVVHKNGDYSDNRVENLEWTSRAERYDRTSSTCFKRKGAIVWRNEYGEVVEIFGTIKAAAEGTGKSIASVNSCILGRSSTTLEGWTFERIKK